MLETDRFEPPTHASPIETLRGFHKFLRDTLTWKCTGLTEQQLRWSPVESGTSLLAILKHSINTERWWIATAIGGRDVPLDWSADDPDGDWRLEAGDTFESLLTAWNAEDRRSDDVLANETLDRVVMRPGRPETTYSVGWILTHMVEEVARHVGQADIIREQIDGKTGE
jgi:uncharacterized damage-inducible protein DinB